jgi:uncharacterized protein YjbJ (UPF0337 family)
MDSDRIKGTAKEFGGKLEETVGHATGNQDTRAEGIARQIEGKGQNLYGQAKDGLRDAGDLAEKMYDEGRRYAKRGSRDVGQAVEQYPVASLLLAGAVGLLAGVLVSRR